MKKYGYLESGVANSDALYQKTAITNAVKTLQKFGNIPITGQLDNTILEVHLKFIFWILLYLIFLYEKYSWTIFGFSTMKYSVYIKKNTSIN